VRKGSQPEADRQLRSLRFWTVLAVVVIVLTQGVLTAVEQLWLHRDVPNYVFAVFFVAFWAAVLTLLAVGVVGVRERRRSRKPRIRRFRM
jgi:hypothetical protein